MSLLCTVAFCVVAAAGVLTPPDSPTVSTWAIWLGVLWLLLGPILMTDGELHYRRAVELLRADGGMEGWDTAAIDRAARTTDRLCSPLILVLSMLVLALTAWSFDELADRLVLGSVSYPEGVVIFGVSAFLGVAVGSGFWGVVATYRLVRAAVGPEGDAHVAYHPFDARQVQGLEEVTRMSFRSAMYFSTGSLLVPALVQATAAMAPAAQLASWFVIVALLAGGAIVYIAPNIMIARLARRQWADSVDQLAPQIVSRLHADVGVTFTSHQSMAPDHTEPDHTDVPLTTLLELHRELRGLSAHPVNQTAVVQGLSTFILPALVIGIEQALG